MFAALLRLPHTPLDADGTSGEQNRLFWRSLFAQELDDNARALPVSFVHSLCEAQPENFAFLVFACIEQLYLFVEEVLASLRGFVRAGGNTCSVKGHRQYSAQVATTLRKRMAPFQTTVHTALAVLLRCFAAGPQSPNPGLLESLLVHNRCGSGAATSLGQISGEGGVFRCIGGVPLTKSVGYVLTYTLLHLLHCPGFTVRMPLLSELAAMRTCGENVESELGLRTFAHKCMKWRWGDSDTEVLSTSATRTTYIANRNKVLRVCIALMLPPYLLSSQCEDTGLPLHVTEQLWQNKIYRIWTGECKGVLLQHRETLFLSLLNVIAGYRPEAFLRQETSFASALSNMFVAQPSAADEETPAKYVENVAHFFLQLLQHTRFFTQDNNTAREVLSAEQVRSSGDTFRRLIFEFGETAGQSDIEYLIHGLVDKLRAPLLHCGAEAHECKPAPLTQELLAVLALLLENSPGVARVLCSSDYIERATETLLFYVSLETSAASEGAAEDKRRAALASSALTVLLQVSLEATVFDPLSKEWRPPSDLRFKLLSCFVAAPRAEAFLKSEGIISRADLVFTALADILHNAAGFAQGNQGVSWLRADLSLTVLRNLCPALRSPAQVTCEALCGLLTAYCNEFVWCLPERGTPFHLCVLLELLCRVLYFHGSGAASLVACLLDEPVRLSLDAVYQEHAASQAAPLSDVLARPEVVALCHPQGQEKRYADSTWSSNILIRPLRNLVHMLWQERQATVAGVQSATFSADADACLWLRTYLCSSSGARMLQGFAETVPPFVPASPSSAVYYASVDRSTWRLVCTPEFNSVMSSFQ